MTLVADRAVLEEDVVGAAMDRYGVVAVEDQRVCDSDVDTGDVEAICIEGEAAGC
jgi:hypothetical protein